MKVIRRTQLEKTLILPTSNEKWIKFTNWNKYEQRTKTVFEISIANRRDQIEKDLNKMTNAKYKVTAAYSDLRQHSAYSEMYDITVVSMNFPRRKGLTCPERILSINLWGLIILFHQLTNPNLTRTHNLWVNIMYSTSYNGHNYGSTESVALSVSREDLSDIDGLIWDRWKTEVGLTLFTLRWWLLVKN